MPTETVKCAKKCGNNITAKRNPGLTCFLCNSAYHISCANLTKEEFDTIVARKLSWTCRTCSAPKNNSRRSSFFVEPVGTSSNLSTPTTTQVSSSSPHISDFRELKALLTSALQRIDNLESELAKKDSQIDNLSSKLQTLESTCDNIEKHLVCDNLEVQNLPDEFLDNPLDTAISLGTEIGCIVEESDFKVLPYRDNKRLRLTFNCKSLRTLIKIF